MISAATERREGPPKYRANSIVDSWYCVASPSGNSRELGTRICVVVYQRGSFLHDGTRSAARADQGFFHTAQRGTTLIIETRCPPDAKSTEPERLPGTVRPNVESAELENIGGMKAKLQGVIPYRFRTTNNYRTGDSELNEEAQIHEISAVVQGDGEARYTIDWVENLPTRPFHWPGSIDTKTEILTTRKIGIGDDVITLFGKQIEQSGANHAVKIAVARR